MYRYFKMFSAFTKNHSGIARHLGPTAVDPDRNEALEQTRPGDAVFRAIFGSDDEDD